MMRRHTSKHAGFSLLELMVGMVLGLIVVAGAVSIYLASSRSYSEVEQSAQLSENARFAEQLLADALRHVGFTGEVKAEGVTADVALLPPITNDCNTIAATAAYQIGTPLYAVLATEDLSDPDIGCFGTDEDNNALDGTQILIMKSAIPHPISDGPRDGSVPRTGTLNTGLTEPTLAATLAGKLWIMTNNTTGLMFDGNGAVPYADVPEGTAWEYRYEVYFIHDTRDDDGKLMPSLSRFVLQDAGGGAMELVRQELVPGVEDMQMRFGVDDTGNGEVDLYATVDELETSGDWGSIVAIDIGLLVSTLEPDPNYTDTNTYTLAGTDVDPPATRLQHRRLVVRSNISMRNRKLLLRG